MKRLILFLIRKRLGVRLNEKFQFTNQRAGDEYYYFTKRFLMKYDNRDGDREAHVSLNWVLDERRQTRHYKGVA